MPGETVWIEAADGRLVNVSHVVLFRVAEVTDWIEKLREHTSHWALLADTTDRDASIELRRFDGEEQAERGLLMLRNLLPGRQISADLDLDPDEEEAHYAQ